jgi:hypothetical protein
MHDDPVDSVDMVMRSCEPTSTIADVLAHLGEHATADVHAMCGLVHRICVPPCNAALASGGAVLSPSSQGQQPYKRQLDAGSAAPDSSSEYGGTSTNLYPQHSQLLHSPRYALPQGHRLWFREQDCTFSALRVPGAMLRAAELQFILDVAFHCPVSPVARLFQLVLRVLDARGKIPQQYHTFLIGTELRERYASLPDIVDAAGATANQRVEYRLVPPPSIPLTEYVAYLELLDAGYYDMQHVPRPLCSCSRLQLAAATRNAILGDIFLEMGEVNNYYRVLSGFPSVLAQHHRSMQFLLLHPDGPIAVEERCMIAIMAAARHRCEYLVRRYAAALLTFTEDGGRAEHFLRCGPNDRLQLLQPLIAVLAHTPWTWSIRHIENVVSSGEWSIPELMQAVCIVTTVLPLCGLTMGLGVPTEMSTCAILPTDIFPCRPTATLPISERRRSCSADELGVHPLDCAPRGGESDPLAVCTGINYLRYCGVDKIVTVPRINRSSNLQTTRSISENSFGWQDGAAYLVEQYYPQFAELFSDELLEIQSVVEQQQQQCQQDSEEGGVSAALQMIQKKSASSPETSDGAFVWRALRLYILNLLGVTADDFPYESINKVLTRGAKTFAQKSFGYPERLCLADLTDWSRTATNSTQGDQPTEEEAGGASPKWFNEEVVLVLVALFTCATRREGLMVSFLSEFAAYQRSL